MNIIVCININEKKNKSWSLSGVQFIDSLKRNNHNVVVLNYEISSLWINYLNKLISIIYYKTPFHFRSPFIIFFRNLKFEYLLYKYKEAADLIVHFGSVAITRRIAAKVPNVIVTDATLAGSVRYGGIKYSDKYLVSFSNEFNKINKNIKLIFTFNEWTKISLVQDYNCNIDKIINIGFGANLIPYTGNKDYSNYHILIILRRGLEVNKGLFLLLDAFKIAYKRNSNLKLSVVGTTLDPIQGVTYYEGFPRQKTIELFHDASLFAMPALFEPNGMVYIEALSCKTPILGLDRLAFPEFCGYGKYGFIVKDTPEDIADTIIFALSNPIALKQMGESGQEYALNRFSWDLVEKTIIEESFKN
jgi:glycosyltransferase involved in cell wall biosynthesis